MRLKHVILLGLTATLIVQAPLRAQEKPGQFTLPDDPAKAWAEVQKVHPALRPPADWATRAPKPEEVAAFQKQIRETALSFSEKAREFIARFPSNENVGDARITVVYVLNHAVAAGDTNAEDRIQQFCAATLANQAIPEDDRVGVLAYAGTMPFFKLAGMRFFTEGLSKMNKEFEAASLESTRAALKQFPANSQLWTMFVAQAQRAGSDQQKAMAQEILNAPGALPGVKTLARHILEGTQPYQIGKPVDIRFTALDGREVDLAKLTNKVALVEFWSTTCGPCVAEMPMVKTAYEKLHPLGFEVIAISFDEREAALSQFIKEHALPWPQEFEGKGWENQFAVRYGIFSIPTMWLVDKRGNLRDVNPRSQLEAHVTTLLDEKMPTGPR